MGHPHGYDPFLRSGQGFSSRDMAPLFNLVTGGAFLVGAGGVSLAGGILAGLGYLAAKGVMGLAKLIAGQTQMTLKSADDPDYDMNNLFDRLQSRGRAGELRVPNQLDCSKALDLLTGNRQSGVNYSSYQLLLSGKSILETDSEGVITANAFEGPLTDPRIAKILNSALRNRQEGIPVGSQSILFSVARIPDDQLATLATMVADIIQREQAVQSNTSISQQLHLDNESAMDLDEIDPFADDIDNPEEDLDFSQSALNGSDVDRAIENLRSLKAGAYESIFRASYLNTSLDQLGMSEFSGYSFRDSSHNKITFGIDNEPPLFKIDSSSGRVSELDTSRLSLIKSFVQELNSSQMQVTEPLGNVVRRPTQSKNSGLGL